MGLFETVVNNAKATANAVGRKASEVVDISKLKINSADISSEIKLKYEALGKLVYNARKTDTIEDEPIQKYIKDIDCLYSKLEQINDQISKLKNKVKCSKCGCYNSNGAKFCVNCGAKLSESIQDTVDVRANTKNTEDKECEDTTSYEQSNKTE